MASLGIAAVPKEVTSLDDEVQVLEVRLGTAHGSADIYKSSKDEKKVEAVKPLVKNDDPDTRSFTLISRERKEFVLPRKHVLLSGLVKTALDADPEESKLCIDLDAQILGLMVDYLNIREGVALPPFAKPIRSLDVGNTVPKKDMAWYNSVSNQSLVMECYQASNQLDISSAFELLTYMMAVRIKSNLNYNKSSSYLTQFTDVLASFRK